MEATEDPETKPHYVHLIIHAEGKTIQWKKIFIKWCWCNWKQKNQNRSILIILHKTHVQVDEGPNINPDTLDFIEEKVGNNLEHIGTRGNFMNRI